MTHYSHSSFHLLSIPSFPGNQRPVKDFHVAQLIPGLASPHNTNVSHKVEGQQQIPETCDMAVFKEQRPLLM